MHLQYYGKGIIRLDYGVRYDDDDASVHLRGDDDDAPLARGF